MTGSTSEPLAAKQFPEAQIQSFDTITDAFGALKSGQLDAVITAYTTALLMTRKNPELRILDERLSNEDTSVAVRKGNTELLQAVDKILKDLKAEGAIESMDKRWFKTEPGPYEEIDIPLPTAGEPLRVGVAATREPFSFVDKDGRVSGHDGELARLIAQRLNRPIEFQDMKFMALIPALQSGKIDVIVTGMSATEQRRKFIDFTDPYYANSQVMMVRKPEGVLARKLSFWEGLMLSVESNIVTEDRYLLLWEGLKTTFIISVLATIFGTVLGGIVCFMRMSRSRVSQHSGQDLHLGAARHSGRRAADADLLRRLRLGEHQPGPGRGRGLRPQLRGLCGGDLPHRRRGHRHGADRGGPRHGLQPHADLQDRHPAADDPAHPARLQGRVHLDRQDDVHRRLHRGAGPDQGQRHHPGRTFDAFFPLVLVAVLYFLISYLLILLMDWAERSTDPRRKIRKAAEA